MTDQAANDIPCLTTEQQSAKAAILADCEKLKAEGITYVAMHFDGYSDEMTTDDIKSYQSDWYNFGEVGPVEYDASYLQKHFSELVPFGYEDGCGAFGDVLLNVETRTITVERNDRFEDYNTVSYEV